MVVLNIICSYQVSRKSVIGLNVSGGKHTNLDNGHLTILLIAFFLLGDSPSSEFYVPTFWNTLSLPSS